MKRKFILALYLPLILIANAVSAADADKLDIFDAPRDVVDAVVQTPEGDDYRFGESETKIRVVNFWALWCVPCRKEMPTLDALSEEFDPKDLTVSAVAVGRNDPEKIDVFFSEIGVKNLPLYFDKRQKFAGAYGALGLPHTIFLNAKGQEIARVIGDANYMDEALQAKIQALVDAQTDM